MMAAMILLGAAAASSSGQARETIVDEWAAVKAPPPPELTPVTVDPKITALLILDIQNQNCNLQRRPRCVASLPGIQDLLRAARAKRMPVVYTLTRNASKNDIRREVALSSTRAGIWSTALGPDAKSP